MVTCSGRNGLSWQQAILKRSFDILISLLGLMITWWIILVAFIAASIDLRQNGFFTQARIGLHGDIFRVIKIRTMRPVAGFYTTVTTSMDPRITVLGRFFRRSKIDELPQLINVLIGNMSFVGPRPDVPGFADLLEGDDRIILSVRPGITGPASLQYRNEEQLLRLQDDPEKFNREVIFPEKVRINKDYILNYSLLRDIKYIWATLLG